MKFIIVLVVASVLLLGLSSSNKLDGEISDYYCMKTISNEFKKWNNQPDYLHAKEISTGIWVGTICAALDTEWIKEKNVTYVITVGSEQKSSFVSSTDIRYHHFPLDDEVKESEKEFIEITKKAIRVITEATRIGITLLLHCDMRNDRCKIIANTYLNNKALASLYSAKLRPIRLGLPYWMKAILIKRQRSRIPNFAV